MSWLIGLVLLGGVAVELFVVHILLKWPPQLGWLIDVVVLTAVLTGVGIALRAHPLGILIDERNKVSLSRLQTALWTVVVLTAFAAIGLSRVGKEGIADPLAVAIPEQLLWAIGITASALIGTPLIRTLKEGGGGRVTGVVRTARGTLPTNKFAVGTIVYNNDISQAKWTDLFEGEETGNEGVADLGKIQMFYFTVIAAIVYSLAVFQLLSTTAPRDLTGLPVLSEGMVALLGLSNGAYLAKKVVPVTVP